MGRVGRLWFQDREEIYRKLFLKSAFLLAGWSFRWIYYWMWPPSDSMGGFWIWDGRVLSWDINHHVFMSVIWVNFLGYLFETPAVVYLTLRLNKLAEKSRLMAILALLGAGLGAVITVGVGSSLSLLLNKNSDEWFAVVAFLVLWAAILVKLLAQIAKRWHTLTLRANHDFVLGFFWAVIYGYCLVALWSLGAFHTNIVYALFAAFIALATLLMSFVSTNAYTESD
ncbi:hypothetical protein [Mobiluncus sp.]|uniref:hypothetical protein n=1 Tax=Mobiluncus sp. TaxID=47293 RepID=UPI002A9109BF|nr:hypothetical protein [Mobiluncus sp.]MDY6076708.1 hypothetical protein [Mobiluncus sp.]